MQTPVWGTEIIPSMIRFNNKRGHDIALKRQKTKKTILIIQIPQISPFTSIVDL